MEIGSALIVLTSILSIYFFIYKPNEKEKKRKVKKNLLEIINDLGTDAYLETIQTEVKDKLKIKISKADLYKIIMKMDEKDKLIARKEGYYVLTAAGETKLKKTIRIKEESEEENI